MLCRYAKFSVQQPANLRLLACRVPVFFLMFLFFLRIAGLLLAINQRNCNRVTKFAPFDSEFRRISVKSLQYFFFVIFRVYSSILLVHLRQICKACAVSVLFVEVAFKTIIFRDVCLFLSKKYNIIMYYTCDLMSLIFLSR